MMASMPDYPGFKVPHYSQLIGISTKKSIWYLIVIS